MTPFTSGAVVRVRPPPFLKPNDADLEAFLQSKVEGRRDFLECPLGHLLTAEIARPLYTTVAT